MSPSMLPLLFSMAILGSSQEDGSLRERIAKELGPALRELSRALARAFKALSGKPDGSSPTPLTKTKKSTSMSKQKLS